jgi:1,4-alpha-glucan branching enzyme
MTSIRPDGRVEFRFFRPDAMDVKVLGTFNQWNGDSIVLGHEGDGWWSTIADIEVGEHRFRYWADGNWFTDFASYGVELDKYGWNSVLLVPKTLPELMPALVIGPESEERIQLKSAA